MKEPTPIQPTQSDLDFHANKVVAQMKKGAPCYAAMNKTEKAFSSLPNEKNKVYIGFEWELFWKGHYEDNVKKLVDTGLHKYVSSHVDGGDTELTTIPATLDFHKKWITEELIPSEVGQNILAAEEKNNVWGQYVGLHVHIDIRAFTRKSLLKMIGFCSQEENQQFLYNIADRTGKFPDLPLIKDSNARLKGVDIEFINNVSMKSLRIKKSGNAVYNLGRDTYFNLTTGKQTLEFRLFRTAHNVENLFYKLEMIDALVRYCRVSSWQNLRAFEFCQYVMNKKNKYPYLAKNEHVLAVLENKKLPERPVYRVSCR